MNKKLRKRDPLRCDAFKIIAISMKIFMLLTLVGVVQANASLFSQNNLINLKLRNATVYEAVNEIAHQSELFFIFHESDDAAGRSINLDLQSVSLDDAMKEVLKNSNLEYDLIENYIVVKPARAKAPQLQPVQLQERITIRGTITSAEDGTTIPGATVLVRGTTLGTTSDLDGNYQIDVLPENTHLIFSFVGMITREIPINGRTVINVQLEPDVLDLGELVVVGYGTESSRLVSGSLGVVSDSEIRDVPLRTIDGVLQGRSHRGANISQNSGTPGAANTVRIRGNSSISAGNEPLYVIDGIPMTIGNYGQIGFQDRESMPFLISIPTISNPLLC
jgi:TonB-dependent starch-binding outer membrane protein SusC